MIISFNAVLHSVREIEIKDKISIQHILFQKPIYNLSTGDFIRNDIFPASILNENIDRLNAYEKLGEIVHTTCSLSSFKKEKADEVYYNLSLLCIDMADALQPEK